MRFAALRRCGAVEERDTRPRDACQTGLVGIGLLGVQERARPRLLHRAVPPSPSGGFCPCGVPVAGQPGLVSPSIVSAPPSAAHACGNPACLRGRAGDVGAGRRSLLSGIWGFEAAAPPFGGDPLRCRPGDNDSWRFLCSWQTPLYPDSAGRVNGPRDRSAPGLSPTWRLSQLELYVRSRKGERGKPGKRCRQLRQGQQPHAPLGRWFRVFS